MPSAVAFAWIARTARRIESTDVSGSLRQLADEERALVGLVDEAEQREREEEQRHEREQREVGDHRGEVGAAVGEELRVSTALTRGSMLGSMDAAQAICDLTEISPQVEHVVARSRRRRGRSARIADERAQSARRGRTAPRRGRPSDRGRGQCRSSRRRRRRAASSSCATASG